MGFWVERRKAENESAWRESFLWSNSSVTSMQSLVVREQLELLTQTEIDEAQSNQIPEVVHGDLAISKCFRLPPLPWKQTENDWITQVASNLSGSSLWNVSITLASASKSCCVTPLPSASASSSGHSSRTFPLTPAFKFYSNFD
jgi:hypothetical protein